MVEKQTLQFHTSPAQEGKGRRAFGPVGYTLRPVPRHTRTRRSGADVEAGGMLVKLGICAAACLLVLVANEKEAVGVYAAEQAQGYAEEVEEEPGKLHFVEMPGLLSVFAPKDAYELPIECAEHHVSNGNTQLCMVAAQTQSVACPMDARVLETGEAAEQKAYVRLLADGAEYLFTGFSSISVEAGQGLLSGDTLGSVEAGATLSLELWEDGEAVDISERFSL